MQGRVYLVAEGAGTGTCHGSLELLSRLGALLDAALNRAEASLTAAMLRAFERGLVPDIDPPDGLEVELRYRPGVRRLWLGGDFMDVVAFSEDSAGFVIGDVSGHGPEEAAFAVGVHAAWQALAKTDPRNPAAWLALLDETFFDRSVERLATALTGRVDIPQRTLTLASAGHCAPVIVGADACLLEDQPDPMLGIGHSGRRKETTVTLRDDQGLFVYTDGLIEQRKPDRSHERWNENDLLAWLDRSDATDDLDLDALLWDFGRNEFADDVAVMLLRLSDRARVPQGQAR